MGLTCIKTHKPSLLWNVSCFYEWVLSIVDATCCRFLATEMAERHDAKAVLQIARGLVHRLQDMIENKWFRRLVTTPTHLASAWNFRCQDNFSSFVHSDENFHSRNSFCLMHNDWNFHGWSFRHCGGSTVGILLSVVHIRSRVSSLTQCTNHRTSNRITRSVQIEHIRRFVMGIFPSPGIPRLTQMQEKMTKFETKEEGKGSLIHSLLELILVSRQSTSKRCKSINYWAVDWQCFPPGPRLTTCSNLPTVWLFESPT